MSTMREFTCDDLFKFNNVNMDKLTETVCLSLIIYKINKYDYVDVVYVFKIRFGYCQKMKNNLFFWSTLIKNVVFMQYNLGFYLQYITTWPDFNYTVEAPDGRIQGYSTWTCGVILSLVSTSFCVVWLFDH